MSAPLSPRSEWGQGDLGGEGAQGGGQERSGEFPFHPEELPELFSMVRFPFSAAEWTLIAVKGPGGSLSSLPPSPCSLPPFLSKGFQGIRYVHQEPLGGLEM